MGSGDKRTNVRERIKVITSMRVKITRHIRSYYYLLQQERSLTIWSTQTKRRSWYAVGAFACQKMPKADYWRSSWPCRSTNIRMMYRSFRTDLPPLLLTTPAKYSFHESTSAAPRRSRESVRIIFAVVLEVIVTCHSAAIYFRYLGHVEHCDIQVYRTARETEDRRRL